MTLAPHEFIRRFLLHVLPRGFHRIRHYGLLASSARKADITRARELLAVTPAPPEPVEAPEELWRKLGDGGEEGGVTGLVFKPPEPPRWSVTP